MSIIRFLPSCLSIFVAANSVLAMPAKINQPVKIAQSITITDTLIVPGERVGAITRHTSKQDLVKLFGASRLVDKTISGAEGIGSFAATEVKGGDRSLLVIWTDSTRTKISQIRISGTAWKTREGIRLDISLTELRQKLGNFKLYGLGWDYGGTVLLESSRLFRYQGKLILRVDASTNAAQRYPKQYNAVSGDSTFTSSNPNWQPLGITVRGITVLLNPGQS